jgi:Leucine-rich repeat (LRR) protein
MPDSIAPPSSPPLIPIGSRKRHLEEDLPVFSSDPIDPSIDSTATKRLYRGPWWNYEPKSAPTFSRNFDSGIHLPSDDSLQSLPDIDANPPPNSIQSKDDKKPLGGTIFAPASASQTQAHAVQIIEDAINNDQEVFDLSGLGLNSVPSSLLEPIKTIVKVPQYLDGSDSPSETLFHSLKPTPQLYLSNNLLSTLPPSIWALENLTVLSLRNNNIAQLPPSISRLTNLVELNIANNHLRWLPWELLNLIRPDKPLIRLHALPNPFVHGVDIDLISQDTKRFWLPSREQIVQTLIYEFNHRNGSASQTPIRFPVPGFEQIFQTMFDDFQRNDPSHSLTSYQLSRSVEHFERLCKAMNDKTLGHLTFEESIALIVHAFLDYSRKVFVVSSQIHYLRPDGSPNRTAPPSTSQEDLIPAHMDQPRNLSTLKETSKAPSLLELSIQACSTYHDLEAIESLLDDAPQPVLRALQAAQSARNEGGRICSVCKRSYIIPQTEWIEYWYVGIDCSKEVYNEDLFWPFLRRGCTHACVQ